MQLMKRWLVFHIRNMIQFPLHGFWSSVANLLLIANARFYLMSGDFLADMLTRWNHTINFSCDCSLMWCACLFYPHHRSKWCNGGWQYQERNISTRLNQAQKWAAGVTPKSLPTPCPTFTSWESSNQEGALGPVEMADITNTKGMRMWGGEKWDLHESRGEAA